MSLVIGNAWNEHVKRLVFVTDRMSSSAIGDSKWLSRIMGHALAVIYSGQFETFKLSAETGAAGAPTDALDHREASYV